MENFKFNFYMFENHNIIFLYTKVCWKLIRLVDCFCESAYPKNFQKSWINRNETVKSKKRETRRERLKSAPYLKLKKLKLFETVKGGTLWVFWKSNLLQGVTSQTSDIACWDKWERFSNLRLLLGKTEYNLGITSKIRI